LSAEPSSVGDAPSAADTVAGFLAAIAIFAALAGIVWHPLRLIPAALVLSLLASAMSVRMHRLAIAAVAISGISFFTGMTLAVVLRHPVW
jgi:hypothetical protein